MKHWLIEYSIKYTDGRQKEEQAKLTAKDITIAVAMALTNISGPLLQDPDLFRCELSRRQHLRRHNCSSVLPL